jgi:ABC-2 type transport system permease protein
MGRAFASAFFRELKFLRTSRFDLALSTVLPAAVLLLMGFLFMGGVPRKLPVALVDLDHSAFSRDAARMLDAAPGIRIAGTFADMTAALPEVRSGRAYGVFLIPEHAGREVGAGRRATLVLYTNDSYYTAAVTLERESTNVIAALAADAMRDEVARGNLKRARPPPVTVESTTLYNSGASYELMIVSVLNPSLIVILISCAVITSVGREFSRRTVHDWIARPRDALPALCGKTAPYFLIYLLFGILCIVWLAWGEGYPVAGSIAVLIAALVLMLLAYVALGALMVAVMRDSAMALGGCAVYASSALTFSGAFFPIRGGNYFAQSWSAVQPFTWYTQVSAQAWQMGAPASASLTQLAILLALAAGLWLGAATAFVFAAKEA